MKSDYPAVIETPNDLEPRLYLDLVYCCRAWPVAVGYPIGRCGYCGEVPGR